jgi:hypothetical protein
VNKKSIFAIVAGVLFTIVVTTLVDIGLYATGIYPPMSEPMNDSNAVLATFYRIVIAIVAAWLTAKLAPSRPMKHALILGAVGVVLGSIGVVAAWGKGLGPTWYPVALVILAIPQCWAGGKLYEMLSARKEKQKPVEST